MDSYVIGVDVGTQGTRAVAVNANGTVVARAEEPMPPETLHTGPGGTFEQDAMEWWRVTQLVLSKIGAQLAEQQIAKEAIVALSVSGTSGTFVPLDISHKPLLPALMYSDNRAKAEVERCNEVLADLTQRLGYRFNASFALPKLLWLQEHEPYIWARTALIAHQADFIVGQLTGIWGVSDYTNVLKTGYDLLEECYPPGLSQQLGIAIEQLPRIVSPGTPIGTLTPTCADILGLSSRTLVVAGLTDGCASQFAAGATKPGEWVSSLGTTLTIKGTSTDLIKDPLGRIYCHRHPEYGWLPGGASNTGGEVIARRFPNADLAAYNTRGSKLAPSSLLVYPLMRHGERFPLNAPNAGGFIIDLANNEQVNEVAQLSTDMLYVGCLEGVAMVERLAYEVASNLGASLTGPIRTVGGATRSKLWLRIRASVFNRPFVVPSVADPAMGTAVLAASGRIHTNLSSAAQAMVHMTGEVTPDSNWTSLYEDRYQHLKQELHERGYGV